MEAELKFTKQSNEEKEGGYTEKEILGLPWSHLTHLLSLVLLLTISS